MLRKLSFFLLTIVVISLQSGCVNNIEDNEITDVYSITERDELTNPGEYLSDLCSNVKIDDVEFSLPCTYEELSNKFIIKSVGYETLEFEEYGFNVQTYALFTKENLYVGLVSFTYYSDNSNKIWTFESDSRKLSLLSNDSEHYADDTPAVVIGDFVNGETTKSDIQAKLGNGYYSSNNIPSNNEYEYILYFFEDGYLMITCLENAIDDIRIWFDPRL